MRFVVLPPLGDLLVLGLLIISVGIIAWMICYEVVKSARRKIRKLLFKDQK